MIEYSYLKKALFRELSEDAAQSTTELARKLHCSRNTVASNMAVLEKEYGLKYTLEFDRERIGFINNQIAYIKFEKKPSLKEIKDIFSDRRFLPLVATTEGDFDVIVKVIIDQTSEHNKWRYAWISRLLEYMPTIRASMINFVVTGFTPLTKEVLERIDLAKLNLDAADRQILILLNENSRISYNEISKKTKLDIGTVRYRLGKISKSGMIKRYTAYITRPPKIYSTAYFLNYRLNPGIFERAAKVFRHYAEVDGNLKFMNVYQYEAALIGCHGSFGICCTEDEEQAVHEIVDQHREIYKGDDLNVEMARITNVITGALPIRNIDMRKRISEIRLV